MLLSILLLATASPLPLDTGGCRELWSLPELSFTFNVEKEGEVVASRSWTWEPRTERVRRTVDGTRTSFIRGKPEGEAQRTADAQFVNDWFWLMPQCHVVASGDAHFAIEGPAPLPVGEGTGPKLVVTYSGDGGGYTPGDAYDLFLDDRGRIAAWNYRKGNQPEPSLSTSFTDYKPLGPVEVATEHRSPDGGFRIFFTGLAVGPPD